MDTPTYISDQADRNRVGDSSAWVKPVADNPDAFSAVTSVAYKSDQSFVDTPTYISDQADRNRVGDGELKTQDAMVMALTRARGNVASVDDLWADGGSRYQGQYNSVIALYGTANGDYLVGRASSNENGAKTVQALAGLQFSDCIVWHSEW